MIRRLLLGRLVLVSIVAGLIALVILFGRWVGLTEVLIVALIIAVILIANGAIFLIGQVVKGYRGQG